MDHQPVPAQPGRATASSSLEPPRGAPPRARRRKWRWRWVIIGFALLLIAAIAFYYWRFMRPYESTDDAFIDGNVTPLAPQVAGRVIRLFVRDNQAVNRGQVVLEIDPRDYQARLAQTQASVAAAQTRLQQARAQVTADQAKVGQMQASLDAAQADAERAQAELKRYQAVQGPAVSRSQYDQVAAQARASQAAVEVARHQVQAAQAQADLSKAAVQTAEAVVKQADAAVRQAELELSYTKLTVLEDGFVAHRTVDVGVYVQPGEALMALVPTNLWVTANFKETQLRLMRPGQRTEIHVDAYPQHAFPGHVDSIQRGSGARFSLLPPENASGNYVKVVQRVPVKILFDEPPNPNLPLGPGMSVVPKVRVR